MKTSSDIGSPRISIIIPAFNEETLIGLTLSAIQEALKEEEESYEIIVVDDGSVDNTADVARKAGAQVITHERNLGYGKSLLSGFKQARGDIIIFFEANLSFNPQDIKKLIKNVEEADLTIGSRYIQSGKKSQIPFYKALINKIRALMIYFSTGVKVTDPDSGFRAIHKKKLDHLHLEFKDFSINYEMIAKAAKMGFKISEVPVLYREWWKD
jgi:glycosyltransferase involved in cell wall biosynthesis